MAFVANSFVCLQTQTDNAGALWVYFSADDSVTTIITSAYMDTAVDHGLATGDLIIISGSTAGDFGIYEAIVTAGVVTFSTTKIAAA